MLICRRGLYVTADGLNGRANAARLQAVICTLLFEGDSCLKQRLIVLGSRYDFLLAISATMLVYNCLNPV